MRVKFGFTFAERFNWIKEKDCPICNGRMQYGYIVSGPHQGMFGSCEECNTFARPWKENLKSFLIAVFGSVLIAIPLGILITLGLNFFFDAYDVCIPAILIIAVLLEPFVSYWIFVPGLKTKKIRNLIDDSMIKAKGRTLTR